MNWLLVNVPLMVAFIALWVGVPAWLVLRHPDAGPRITAAPAVKDLPVARSGADRGYRRVA